MEARIRKLFNEMTCDDGLLAHGVFQEIFSNLGWKDADVQRLHNVMDTNKDGNVDMDEFLTWALKPVPGQSVGTAVDSMGDAIAASKLGWNLQHVKDNLVIGMCSSLLHVTDPENLGIGRDVKSFKRSYKKLEIAHVWKIIKPDVSDVYQLKMKRLKEDLKRIRKGTYSMDYVTTKLDDGGILGLDSSVNEQVLLHGTKPENLLAIIHNGLDERLSGGMFGRGIYLSEDPSKIDQYCTADDGDPDLHAQLYEKFGLPAPGEVFYCFVVQAGLGATVHTVDGMIDATTGADVWFDPHEKRQLVAVPDTNPPIHFHTLIADIGKKVKRHREFIVFDSDRTILCFLIAYRRV